LKYFKIEEFDSPDAPGSGNYMDENFLVTLDEIREFAAVPFIINSGYRTPLHNAEVGGTENSAHLRGLAVDIKAFSGEIKFLIAKSALMHGVQRIGFGKSFIHLDADKSLPSPRIWIY